jgi:hypothetical protein
VQAHNAATASENKIHDDAVARQHGFSGGLVPGITVFGYLSAPIVKAWGRGWLERGSMSARFRQPIYDGDDITVVGTVDSESADVVARNSSDEVCGLGTARLFADQPEAPSIEDYPTAPLADPRFPPTPEALAGVGVLGSLEAGFHADRADPALLGDDLPIYRELGVAHPVWMLYFANAILAANVALGPWIHTASAVQNLSLLHDGDRLSVRGRIAGLTERRGHQIVDLDLLMVADDIRPVMHVLHSAIYRLRSTDHQE